MMLAHTKSSQSTDRAMEYNEYSQPMHPMMMNPPFNVYDKHRLLRTYSNPQSKRGVYINTSTYRNHVPPSQYTASQKEIKIERKKLLITLHPKKMNLNT